MSLLEISTSLFLGHQFFSTSAYKPGPTPSYTHEEITVCLNPIFFQGFWHTDVRYAFPYGLCGQFSPGFNSPMDSSDSISLRKLESYRAFFFLEPFCFVYTSPTPPPVSPTRPLRGLAVPFAVSLPRLPLTSWWSTADTGGAWEWFCYFKPGQ